MKRILLIPLLAPFIAAGVHAQAPTVSTTAASSITGTGARSGGTIVLTGLTVVSERGVLYAPGNLTTPTSSAQKVQAGSGAGTFTASITGLQSNTAYTVWAYARWKLGSNPEQVALGKPSKFTTATIPTLTTTAISNIVGTTATSGGNITSDGRMAVTARGVVWSTTHNPTVALTTRTNNGTGTGVFASNITGLAGNTTYFVRAYATNGVGTAYGAEVNFTTAALPDLVPRPTGSNGNRALFKPQSASFSAGNITFKRLPNVFCQGLTQGTHVLKYPCALPDSCNEYRHSITLPAVNYTAANTGASGSGAFSVALLRQVRTNGTMGTLTQVASSNVVGVNAGATATNFSFTPPGNVDIYTFPNDNPGACFVRCDPNQGGCVVPLVEEAYEVRVDGGNGVPNGGQVPESNENNNNGNPMP